MKRREWTHMYPRVDSKWRYCQLISWFVTCIVRNRSCPDVSFLVCCKGTRSLHTMRERLQTKTFYLSALRFVCHVLVLKKLSVAPGLGHQQSFNHSKSTPALHMHSSHSPSCQFQSKTWKTGLASIFVLEYSANFLRVWLLIYGCRATKRQLIIWSNCSRHDLSMYCAYSHHATWSKGLSTSIKSPRP